MIRCNFNIDIKGQYMSGIIEGYKYDIIISDISRGLFQIKKIYRQETTIQMENHSSALC
jgi:hypothetical protein